LAEALGAASVRLCLTARSLIAELLLQSRGITPQ
jgi:hypothetical protein